MPLQRNFLLFLSLFKKFCFSYSTHVTYQLLVHTKCHLKVWNILLGWNPIRSKCFVAKVTSNETSHFSFFVFDHFWRWSYKNTKISHNLCLHFARQDEQEGENRKENHATKVTKIPKNKKQKGMNETQVMKCSKQ